MTICSECDDEDAVTEFQYPANDKWIPMCLACADACRESLEETNRHEHKRFQGIYGIVNWNERNIRASSPTIPVGKIRVTA